MGDANLQHNLLLNCYIMNSTENFHPNFINGAAALQNIYH